ncbi:MAG TPA: NlpC/P60 family protein [Coriobacteriia bacterium]
MQGGTPIKIRRLIAAALSAVLIVSASPAYAESASDKRARAVVVKRELDRLDAKLETAVEDYDQASVVLRGVNAKVSSNKSRLRDLGARIAVLQTSLGVRADGMYRTGPLGVLDVLLGTASFEDFATTWEMLNQLNEQESLATAELRDARAESLRVEADLEKLQAKARVQVKIMTDRRRIIGGQIAERKSLLSGLEAEIAALEAEAERRAAKAARARAAAGSFSGGWDWGNPTRAPRGQVVDIAKRYIGRPYLWAASGPGSFDCSGFTMFVYAQVGVSLPHSSRAQIHVGERVSRANLQPGDLVFFGSPIHHVGIYVGGGMMIHSPRTGDHVKIAPLHSNYSGASRP